MIETIGNFRELYLFLLVVLIIDIVFHSFLRKDKRKMFYKNITIYIIAIIYHLRLVFILVPNSFSHSFVEVYGSIFMRNGELYKIRIELIVIVILITIVFIILFSKLIRLLKENRQE